MNLPVDPGNDLCERMTVIQMTALRQQLMDLKAVLEFAYDETDVASACKLMRQEFGSEFPAE